ncbi:MAG: tyrosine-protein phosphatase [Clostridia bacterium]|nr:tyrosine-protein phosphatase [Clostridia bacterium]
MSSGVKAVSVDKGGTVSDTAIPDASKDGYTFLYWKNGDEIFDFGLSVNENVVLTPVYQANTYTLSFEGLSETKTVTFNLEIGDLPRIEKQAGKEVFWCIDGVRINQFTVWNGTENKTATVGTNDVISLNSFQGQGLDLVSKIVNDYLSLTEESEIAAYLFDTKNSAGSNPVEFSWRNLSGDNTMRFTVLVASDAEFKNVEYMGTTSYNTLYVYNLTPGVHYWKVVCSNGIISETDFFEITNTLREIYCGNVVNMRDEGGYQTEFGKIKYGLAYRSTAINSGSADATAVKVLVDQLKVKTELDLRRDVSGLTAPDNNITYYQYGIVQHDFIFPNLNPNRPYSKSYTAALKQGLMLFTDISNYPIVFHCTSGADRTGTFAFILGGLLGMSYEDLVRDYEITSFYKGARWRSNIIVSDGVCTFDPSGVFMDNEINLCDFDKMYRHVMDAYGTGDGKLVSAVVNYLKTVVGLTDSNIEDIRSIMIEGYGD